jgi:hypothetical protein
VAGIGLTWACGGCTSRSLLARSLHSTMSRRFPGATATSSSSVRSHPPGPGLHVARYTSGTRPTSGPTTTVMTVAVHWRYSRSHSCRCTPFPCADDQHHLVDSAHRHGAGQVSGTVAAIIKVLPPAQIEYSARHLRGRRRQENRESRSSPSDDLDQPGTLHTRSGRGKGRLAARSSSCLALFVV